MGTAATRAMQDRINAQEALEAVTYGIRAIDAAGIGYQLVEAYDAQVEAARAVADYRLTRAERGAYGFDRTAMLKRRLLDAKKLVAADVAAAKGRVRSIGGQRQLRLALA